MRRLNKEIVDSYQTYPERILQFGSGNFLRGFTGWMIDKMNKQSVFNGSIVILQSTSKGKVEALNNQDGLYTLYSQGSVEGHPVKEHEIISSTSRGINAQTDCDDYLALATRPELRFIFSNTTEAGITFAERDQLADHPQQSFVGKLTAFLYYRYRAFSGDRDKGLIILPCELIEENGEKIKRIILKFADHWGLERGFSEWILEANTFCNTLVDRIVPGYPKAQVEEVTEEIGYKDELLVVAEPYHLWVIEGPAWLKEEFPAEEAGLNVKIVEDIAPFRTRKVRILNGTHTAMTPVAYLYGIDTVGDSLRNPEVRQFIEDFIAEECIPVLNLPKDELVEYKKEVIDRFENPFVQHYLADIALNAIAKFKTRNLPTLIEYVEKYGVVPKKIAFTLSAWIAFYKGKRGEHNINLVDDTYVLELFKKQWSLYNGTEISLQNIATSILGDTTLWGQNLNDISGLTPIVSEYLIAIEKKGMKIALQDVL